MSRVATAAAAPGVFKQSDALVDELKDESNLQRFAFLEETVFITCLEEPCSFVLGSEGSGHKEMTLEVQNGDSQVGWGGVGGGVKPKSQFNSLTSDDFLQFNFKRYDFCEL